MNLLDFIFPKCCLGCGRVGKYFCNRCTSIIRIIEVNEAICPVCEKPAIDGVTHPRCRGKYTIDGLTGFFRYDGVVKKALKAIKYRYVTDITEELMSRIPTASYNNLSTQTTSPGSVLLPIPLHASRLRYRGFNQAEIIAKFIANRLNLPIRSNLLIRSQKTIPQVEMKNRNMRLKNMERVFTLSEAFQLSNFDNITPGRENVKEAGFQNPGDLNFFLVDDVFTTGATMRAAANVLKRAGASFVWAVTIAR